MKQTKAKTTEDLYVLKVKMGADEYESKGSDYKIFSGINMAKISTKVLVTLSKGEKTREVVMKPFVARKLFNNELTQEIQFRNLSNALK